MPIKNFVLPRILILPTIFLSFLQLIHIFTWERFKDSYIEYDAHVFTFLISATAIVFVIFRLFEKRNFSFPLTWPNIIVGLLVIISLIQYFLLPNIEGRSVINLCLAYLLFLLCKAVLKNPEGRQIIIVSFLVTTLIVIVFIECNKSLFSARSQFEINSGITMNYFAVVSPFLYSLIFYFRQKGRAIFSAIALVVFICCCFLIGTGSARIGWMSSAIAILFIIHKQYRVIGRFNTFFRSFVVKSIIYFSVVIAACIAVFKLLIYKPDSSKGHLLIYQIDLNILKDNILTGVGFNRFQGTFNHYQAEFFKMNPTNGLQQFAGNSFFAFNEFLQAIIEFGIAGLLLLVLFTYILRHRNAFNFESAPIYFGAKAGLIAMGICALTSYPLHVFSISVIAIFYLALFDGYCKPIKIIVMTLPFGVKAILGLIVVTGLFSASINEYKRMVSLENWSIAANEALSGKFEQAEPLYQAAYPGLDKNGSFLFNYGAELAIAGAYTQSISILTNAARFYPNYNLYVYLGQSYQFQRNYNSAEKCYWYAVHMIPSRFLAKFMLLKLYQSINNNNKGQTIAELIVNAPVKIPSKEVIDYKIFAQSYLRRFK